MNERAVAEMVGAHMALSSPAAEIWWRVALGELSAAEGATLVLDGRDGVSEIDRGEIERAKLVFAPARAAQQEEVLAALLAQIREDEVVVDLRKRAATRRLGRATGLVLVVVAVAAALVLWLLPAKQTFVEHYELELSGVTADIRSHSDSTTAEIPRFWIDKHIKVGLVPAEDVEGPLEVVGFARAPSGEVRPLALEPFVHPSGRVDLAVPALRLSEGPWELVFAIGRAGAVPTSWEAIDAGGEEFVVLRRTVAIMAKP